MNAVLNCRVSFTNSFHMTSDAEFLKAYLTELEELANSGFLSKIQVELLRARSESASYETLISRFSLSGPVPVVHGLVRTAAARFWCPGYGGGGDSYLSPADWSRFSELIEGAANELNCVPTDVALSLAQRLRDDRISRARRALLSVDCKRLVSHLPNPQLPSRPWLADLCKELEITICRAQEIELLRRLYCDQETITAWFVRLSVLFDRPLELMFNMDETYVTAKKRLHCLTTSGHMPIMTALPVAPHMTGAVTVHGGGWRMRPLLILPKKKTMRSLEQFERQAYFSSSTTGWMTKNCFRYYAITFVAQLSFLRASWPENLRDESVLLFVDGHSSRYDFVANLIFWLFDVDVVCFPGHSSHLLQMFDVSLASPLKAEYKRELMARQFTGFLESLNAADVSVRRKLTLKELRSNMIESFLMASDKVFTKSNCQKSFEATGIVPYCPERVLFSNLAVEPTIEGVYNRRSGKANGQWLTSDECLMQMFRDENGRDLTEADLKVSLAEICRNLQEAGLDQGLMLGPVPEILIRRQNSTLFQLCRANEL